jgi:hypothetical protein
MESFVTSQKVEISQTLNDLDMSQTYAFSFYYRSPNLGVVISNQVVSFDVMLGDEVLFTLPITRLTRPSSSYVLVSKAGIRPKSSTAILKIMINVDRIMSQRVLVFDIDTVSLTPESSSTVVCSPAAPTITIS